MQYASARADHVNFEEDLKIPLESTTLHSELKETLKKRMRIKNLFDMQGKVFSHVQYLGERRRSGDVVLRAPTGSGKTLAYALPIAQELVKRVVPRLRVLIVVPTRDLASQIAHVFETLTEHAGISVHTAVGTTTIASESISVCKAEVLVATPGRLVYHVEKTEQFDLSDVQYLVLDECDRLLEDSYQNWINKLLPLLGTYRNSEEGIDSASNQGPVMGIFALAMVPHITARNSSRYTGVSNESVRKFLVSATQTTNPMRLHDLDLRDPTFFEPCGAKGEDEQGANVNGKSQMSTVPSSLTERGWVVKELGEKPAGLLVLLGWERAALGGKARKKDQGRNWFEKRGVKLVFTHSVESAHRLCRLLEICAFMLHLKGSILEMSGELSMKRRKEVLTTIQEMSDASERDGTSKSKRFLIVVCSDVLARGMDMVNVDTIINYDAPVHINKYLHRAGRTARAGRSGTVHTLLLEKQAHHFRQMVREADRGEKKVITKNLTVEFPERRPASRVIASALAMLQRVLRREGLGLLVAEKSLPSHTLHELGTHFTFGASKEQDFEDRGESRLANFLQISNGPSPSKRRRKHDLHEENREEYHGHSDNEDTAEVPEENHGDTFADLLFCQVARGLTSSLSKR